MDILKNKTLIYFGPDRWSGLWRNRHQLMSRFAACNNVWYVEPPTMLRDLVTVRRRDTRESPMHRTRLFTRDTTGVKIFHSPWWLPVTGRVPFQSMSIRLYITVLALVTGMRKRRAIVWLSRPNMVEYLDKLPAMLTIYHVVDEYSGYGSLTEEDRKRLLTREIELLRRVDLVFVVSERLLHTKSLYNPNTHLVPNAVDFSAYDDRNRPIPADMANIPRPIIGYSGLIAARLDLDLLVAAAESRPDWSFVLVGLVRDNDCQAQIQRLRTLTNVHFLGQKSVSETPAYVQHFDVCTIPYMVNLRAQHASPLKLYEYAAASKPIIATDFAAARNFEGDVEIVHDQDEFLRACGRCLDADPMSASILTNRRFAAKNTWEQRLEQISNILSAYAATDT